MTKPFACPGQCTFCPLESGMPKSYLSDEPAAQRAKSLEFDPKAQIHSRFEQLRQTGHSLQKVELIVIGGTFSAYPKAYRIKFFKDMVDACNQCSSKNLVQAQKLNQNASIRIVGISIETRPDWLSDQEIRLLRRLGVTKVQLGVQAPDEKILQRIKRGHNLSAIASATQRLRDSGFKVCYHFMPNLPGSNPQKDVSMARLIYSDPRFKPDSIKIYPCAILPGTALEKEFHSGSFKPYSDKDLKRVLTKIKKITPPWVRIDRLVRDISKKWLVAGTQISNMRQQIQMELAKNGQKCACIRCREVGDRLYSVIPDLHTRKILTLGGVEYFLSFENKDQLYSLLRMRLPETKKNLIFKELDSSAIIREVHTFGRVVAISKKNIRFAQHQGLGKRLISVAETIAKKNGFNKIAVISAIGTREYYFKLGYQPQKTYLIKSLQ